LPVLGLYSCASAPSATTAAAGPKGATVNPTPAAPRGEAKPEQPAKPTTPLASTGIGKYGFERPETVKGIYVTAWTAGGTKKLGKLLDIVERTELNSMVIDVRDSGEMYFKTGIALADETGATTVAVVKPETLFAKLKKRNVWPIARVAIFRDNFVPKKYPQRAVQRPDGSLWKDRSGNTWLDPYNKKNWEYIARTVDFALDLGFPEIQLDYVRFPSEGKMDSMRFPARTSYSKTEVDPAQVIAEFCDYIGKRVRDRGAQYSADIFGIISSSTTTDQGIGQSLEIIAKPFDVISPMVYPSHYAKGEYGVKDPNRSPYAIVKKSLQDYKDKVPEAKVRPWLQDFSLFGVRYGAKEVRAQIKAAKELGYEEYLLWNAGNNYTEGALAKAEKEASASTPADTSAAPSASASTVGDYPASTNSPDSAER
jgi:hypothetical protein